MKAAKFEYFYSRSKVEALNKLNEIGDGARIIAGGQSLVPSMNFRLARPDYLIDINGCTDLDYFELKKKLPKFIKSYPIKNSSLILNNLRRYHDKTLP